MKLTEFDFLNDDERAHIWAVLQGGEAVIDQQNDDLATAKADGAREALGGFSRRMTALAGDRGRCPEDWTESFLEVVADMLAATTPPESKHGAETGDPTNLEGVDPGPCEAGTVWECSRCKHRRPSGVNTCQCGWHSATLRTADHKEHGAECPTEGKLKLDGEPDTKEEAYSIGYRHGMADGKEGGTDAS